MNRLIQKEALHVPVSIAVFSLFFFVFNSGLDFLDFLSFELKVFFAATVLTLLSFYIIWSFKKLRLHRTAYLFMGVVAVLMVYQFAEPMVKRAKTINSFTPLTRNVTIFLVGNSLNLPSQIVATPAELIAADMIHELKDSIEEPIVSILALAIAQLVLAAGIGLWIGNGIDQASHLIPVAIVATVADIWSVSAGATAQIVVSHVINYFLVRFPVPATSDVPYLIGLTDYLFLAIFYQAATRFNLGAVKNALLLLLSFKPAVAGALFFKTGLPVLPFMAVFFVAGNIKSLELKKNDIKQISAFIAVIMIIFIIVSIWLNANAEC